MQFFFYKVDANCFAWRFGLFGHSGLNIVDIWAPRLNRCEV